MSSTCWAFALIPESVCTGELAQGTRCQAMYQVMGKFAGVATLTLVTLWCMGPDAPAHRTTGWTPAGPKHKTYQLPEQENGIPPHLVLWWICKALLHGIPLSALESKYPVFFLEKRLKLCSVAKFCPAAKHLVVPGIPGKVFSYSRQFRCPFP